MCTKLYKRFKRLLKFKLMRQKNYKIYITWNRHTFTHTHTKDGKREQGRENENEQRNKT